MNRARAKGPNWLRVFAIPLCLAVASSLGFVAAFLFGEVGRYLSWLGIGLPIIVIACAGVRRAGWSQAGEVAPLGRARKD